MSLHSCKSFTDLAEGFGSPKMLDWYSTEVPDDDGLRERLALRVQVGLAFPLLRGPGRDAIENFVLHAHAYRQGLTTTRAGMAPEFRAEFEALTAHVEQFYLEALAKVEQMIAAGEFTEAQTAFLRSKVIAIAAPA